MTLKEDYFVPLSENEIKDQFQRSTLTNEEYKISCNRARDAYFNNYKWTVNFDPEKKAYDGEGVMYFCRRHPMMADIEKDTVKEWKKHLYEFLQIDKGKTDKISLKFRVLKEIFNLDADAYTSDQAHSLIITTRTVLFHLIHPDAAHAHTAIEISSIKLSAPKVRR
jgi:hypothetical protein